MAQSLNSEPTSTVWKEIESFKTPAAKRVALAPTVGSKAPLSSKIQFQNGKQTLIVFLRHCGCPFAEKTFKILAELSIRRSEFHCMAVSHSSAEATDAWLPLVGGNWDIEMVIDTDRDLYAQWGLGISNTWHILNPRTLYSAYRLGADEGIWNRPTESGSRWQTGGAFAVDRDGTVRWAHVCTSAGDVPDLNAAVAALEDTQH